MQVVQLGNYSLYSFLLTEDCFLPYNELNGTEVHIMRSRFIIILLVILATALWGCGSEDLKSDPDGSGVSIPQAHVAVEGLLSALYTVSDHSLYEKLLEDMEKLQLSGVDSGDATGISSFPVYYLLRHLL